jgi:hypothetical protein
MKLPNIDRANGLAANAFTLETDDDSAESSGRDILGEMEIAARIMITGGDEREDARMTRADRLLIRNAIYLPRVTFSLSISPFLTVGLVHLASGTRWVQ